MPERRRVYSQFILGELYNFGDEGPNAEIKLASVVWKLQTRLGTLCHP